ncbi:MAG: tyrosine-type recombinase/integrase [Pirellulaceae bacterium]|nr:tyrosine-type recombinase/integrase [Pirellulaceae bacterium]
MARKSNTSNSSGKPAKPSKSFPLTAHNSGQWAKHFNRRMYYFGSWRTDPKGTEALKRFEREWPFILDGRTPPPVDTGDGCTIALLCNSFLTSKTRKMESGELSGHTFGQYRTTTDRLVAFFGKERRVDDLRPADFERFRQSLASTLGVVALKNEINRTRIVFKYGFDQRLIDRPVHYGQSFDKPAAKAIRKSRNEAGPNLLEAAEVQSILGAADPILRAMVYLGVNCGLGNSDVANLPISAIDFEGGWLNFPRPKTEIARKCKLWPETITALQAAIEQRPKPKNPADSQMVFLTVQGNRYARVTESETTAGKFAYVNTVGQRFGALLKKLGINGRKRLGFYTLRHCFETAAGESCDQVAVDACMGHADHSMAAAYRERISDDRLVRVSETVRTWLFGQD